MSRTPYIDESGQTRRPRGTRRAVTGQHVQLPPSSVSPPHGITDDAKHQRLVTGMRRVGWAGRPVIVESIGGRFQAWTGSHRIAAARVACVSVRAYLLNPDNRPLNLGDPTQLMRDTVRIKMLAPLGDSYATGLMQREIDEARKR